MYQNSSSSEKSSPGSGTSDVRTTEVGFFSPFLEMLLFVSFSVPILRELSRLSDLVDWDEERHVEGQADPV